MKKFRTDYLFSNSSFMSGISSVFSVFVNYYRFNTAKTDEVADSMAMMSDWGTIGSDIYKVLEKYESRTR